MSATAQEGHSLESSEQQGNLKNKELKTSSSNPNAANKLTKDVIEFNKLFQKLRLGSFKQEKIQDLIIRSMDTLNCCTKVQKVNNIYEIKEVSIKRFITEKPRNTADGFFLKRLVSFLTSSKDFFEAVQYVYVMLDRVQQNDDYDDYFKKFTKEWFLSDAISTCERMESFLEKDLIPYVIFVWDESINIVYDKYWAELGFETDATKSLQEGFIKLLDNPPDNFTEFKGCMEELQNAYFAEVELPVICVKDCANQAIINEYSDDISKYLLQRFRCLSKFLNNMIKGDLFKLLKEHGHHSYFETQDFYRQDKDDSEEGVDKRSHDQELGDFVEIQYLSQECYNVSGLEILSKCKELLNKSVDPEYRNCLKTYIMKQEVKVIVQDFSENRSDAEECFVKLVEFPLNAEMDTSSNFNKLVINLCDILLKLRMLNEKKSINFDKMATHDLNVFIDNARFLMRAWWFILELIKKYD